MSDGKVAERRIVARKAIGEDIRKELKTAIENNGGEKWRIAELMWTVKNDPESVYINWGFRSFAEYADVELGLDSRTVRSYVSIHDKIVVGLKKKLIGKKTESEKVAAENHHSKLVERIKGIGWTKAKIVTPLVLDDPIHAEEEITEAEKRPTRDLQKYVSDRKLEKAGKNKDEKTFPMTFAFFAEQKESVDNALQLAGRAASSDKKGHLMSLICQDYVASNMINEDLGDKSLKLLHLDKFAAMLGVQLIVVDKSTKLVLSGSKVLKQVEITAGKK